MITLALFYCLTSKSDIFLLLLLKAHITMFQTFQNPFALMDECHHIYFGHTHAYAYTKLLLLMKNRCSVKAICTHTHTHTLFSSNFNKIHFVIIGKIETFWRSHSTLTWDFIILILFHTTFPFYVSPLRMIRSHTQLWTNNNKFNFFGGIFYTKKKSLKNWEFGWAIFWFVFFFLLCLNYSLCFFFFSLWSKLSHYCCARGVHQPF